MFVTNWISPTKIQKISEITNFFRHYFLSRTEVSNEYYDFRKKKIDKPVGCSNNAHEKPQEKAGCMSMLIIFVIFTGTLLLAIL